MQLNTAQMLLSNDPVSQYPRFEFLLFISICRQYLLSALKYDS